MRLKSVRYFLLARHCYPENNAHQHEVRRDAVTKDKQPIGRTAVDTAAAKLSIDDTPVTLARLGRPPNKLASGFDPYGGALMPKPPARKKDLRKLGEWIEAKHKAEEIKRQEAALALHTGRGSSQKS